MGMFATCHLLEQYIWRLLQLSILNGAWPRLVDSSQDAAKQTR